MTSSTPEGLTFAGDVDDRTCCNMFHATSPAAAVIRLSTHGCTRDRKFLYACAECAEHLLVLKGAVTCMACVLDHALPFPVKAIAGRWL